MVIPFVNLAHLAFVLWMSVFPYITRKHDTLYLGIMCALVVSWSLCKGECLISYLVRKHADPTYDMGSRTDADEIYRLISTKHIHAVKTVIRGMAVVTFAYVLWRNAYMASTILLLVGLMFQYNAMYRKAWYKAVCVVVFGGFLLKLVFPKLIGI